MSEERLRQIFSKNLKRQLSLHDKQPVDLVNDLKIPFSTVSNWINAAKFPRMGKVELLAQYFGIEKSDLIEEKSESYYTNPETAKLADEMAVNPELKALFDVQRDMAPEDLQTLYDMALVLKRRAERLDTNDPC